MLPLVLLGAIGAPHAVPKVAKMRTLSDGTSMPSVNLGTCCGSDPKVGLGPWLKEARPVMGSSPIGIDTAWNYYDESDIGAILKSTAGLKRSDYFVTTKIPAGFGNATDCTADPSVVTRYMKDNLAQLGLDHVDLALLHHPCTKGSRANPSGKDEPKIDAALWQGLVQAQKAGMVKSIGVSNYKAADLQGVDWGGVKPVVNQCHLSVGQHDDDTIAYCIKEGITYEGFGTMRSCYGKPYTPKLQTIADAHKVGVAQVCLRWVLQRGAVMAIGTGSNATTIDSYTKEDLDLFSFELTDAEMDTINGLK